MHRIVLLIALAGCAGPAANSAGSGPNSAALAKGALVVASPRCKEGACQCRALDQNGAPVGPEDESPIAAGQKRFELRTGRGLFKEELTVEGRGTLSKSTAGAESSCGYVDLSPGRHRVHFHAEASAEEGMTPAFFIYEHGEAARDWYDTLQFRCGAPNCMMSDMREFLEHTQKVRRGIHDPCGSVRVEGVRFEADQKDQQVTKLDVYLTLNVYDFATRFPHGAKFCKGLEER